MSLIYLPTKKATQVARALPSRTLRQMSLVDPWHSPIARVPLMPHEPWPEQVSYGGRTFAFYAETRVVGDPLMVQTYREVAP